MQQEALRRSLKIDDGAPTRNEWAAHRGKRLGNGLSENLIAGGRGRRKTKSFGLSVSLPNSDTLQTVTWSGLSVADDRWVEGRERRKTRSQQECSVKRQKSLISSLHSYLFCFRELILIFRPLTEKDCESPARCSPTSLITSKWMSTKSCLAGN